MRPWLYVIFFAACCRGFAADAPPPFVPSIPPIGAARNHPPNTVSPGKVKAEPPTVPPATEALAVVTQVVRSLKESVEKKALERVHDEDMRLYSALTVLQTANDAVSPEMKAERSLTLTEFGQLVGALHTAADAFDLRASQTRMKAVLDAFPKLERYYAGETLIAARGMADQWVCSMHPDVIGEKGGMCPKCGMELDQPRRILMFVPKGARPASVVQARIVTDASLAVGVPVQARLRLTKADGSPVLLDDLMMAHTKKIHLLIVDPSLTDYHHEHPEPTATPGEYAFRFTPLKPGPYRAWADLRPVSTGFQEYAMAEIPSSEPGEAQGRKEVRLSATDAGLAYTLRIDQPVPQVGQPVPVKLLITQPESQTPFRKLEPVMGTFAHFVGFNEDYQTLLHLHPLQTQALAPQDRGGPELRFQFYAEQPGFYKMFLQVKIEGKDRFIPFGVKVIR